MIKTTAQEKLKQQRAKAVWNLFDQKFAAEYRITVGSATCELAAGSGEVHQCLTELIEKYEMKNVAVGFVGCAGRCDMEPVVTVMRHGEVPVKYAKVTPKRVEEIFKTHILEGTVFEQYTMRDAGEGEGRRRIVTVCTAHGEHTEEADRIFHELNEGVTDVGLQNTVEVGRNAHFGLDSEGPVLYVHPDNVIYRKLDNEKIHRIVKEHFGANKVLNEAEVSHQRLTNRFIPLFGDVRFFGKQLRMALRNCGVIDPESIDEYVAAEGYHALSQALDTMTPQEVVATVERANLRGRGGGGFPTATKWKLAAANEADEKFIICNADEGDPGAFMDRSIIEGDPHTVIEGMILAGYAIGATEGFVYTRVEYPLAVKRLERAIADAREWGLLGKNILGTGWDFDIEVRLGAGAYVCGEETALIQSIEGYRGEPNQKPPFPTDQGLWGKPSIINNVETFANLPVILLDGADWFSSIGTARSKGTKVFALAGKVRNTGLIEVPMGTTLREIIFDIGGGIADDNDFKAVQTGGPAGGCLPAEYLDTPVDYESLQAAGSIMGSGGMIVMDTHTCMVDVARFFMEFMVEESCGQCTPCRAGTTVMLGILEKITAGKASLDDLKKLEQLAGVTKTASLCGLGKCVPNPVQSTLRYFRDEYLEHINDQRCRAGVCKKIVQYKILSEKCVGCGVCKRVCQSNCIFGHRKQPHEIMQVMCKQCGACKDACRLGAIITTTKAGVC